MDGASEKLLLLGIFSSAEDAARRTLIRETMLARRLPSPLLPALFEHRFVIGAKTLKPRISAALSREQAGASDLMLLEDTLENKALGKNRDFFVAVAALFPTQFRWVAKADADCYVVLPNLLRRLSLLASQDGYFGAHWPWPVGRGAKGNSSRIRALASLRANMTVAEAAVPPEQLRRGLKNVAALRGFGDDGAAERPQWFFCGPLYALRCADQRSNSAAAASQSL